MTPRERVLDKAKSIILGNRDKQYGKPEDNFRVISEYWTCYLCNSGREVVLSAKDVAVMLALFKIGRETGSHKEDNIIDAIGYLACAEECYEKSEDGRIEMLYGETSVPFVNKEDAKNP